MHLKPFLLIALLLAAGGLFWWWAFDGGVVAVVVVLVLGVALFLTLRGNGSVKDQLDAQRPDKDSADKP